MKSVMNVATVVLMLVGMGIEAAPTEREKFSGLNPGQYLKQRLSSKADKTTVRTVTGGARARLRISQETTSPEKQAQMLKMISALEELHRTFNSTLSSRITIMPRANGRNSGRKNKVLPAAEGGVKSTTAPPAVADSTASRASADAFVPSLTGQSFRKSLPPQNKKTNKRVCFWKYCSHN